MADLPGKALARELIDSSREESRKTPKEIEREQAGGDEEGKKQRALRGYAAEGVHMSIKQMSGQLLSVSLSDQERYISIETWGERGTSHDEYQD